MSVPYALITIESGNSPITYNTFTSWGLIPTGRLVISPAEPQEKFLEIPGRNGELDISTILTGSMKFKNRTGSLEFYIVPYGYAYTGSDTSTAMLNKTPEQMFQQIYSAIHGKAGMISLDTDPNHCYFGRFKVKSQSAGKTYSRISIDYNLQPAREVVSG